MRRWLRKLFGMTSRKPERESAVARLEAAQRRLKATIPAPADDA